MKKNARSKLSTLKAQPLSKRQQSKIKGGTNTVATTNSIIIVDVIDI